jgi:hypothetical protein
MNRREGETEEQMQERYRLYSNGNEDFPRRLRIIDRNRMSADDRRREAKLIQHSRIEVSDPEHIRSRGGAFRSVSQMIEDDLDEELRTVT